MTVQIDQRKIQLPQSWNDLPLKGLLHCYAIIMLDADGFLQPEELLPFQKLRLVKHLLKLSDAYVEQWEQDRHEEYGDHDGQIVFLAELQELLATVDFLFESVETTGLAELQGAPKQMSIALSLTRCPYSYIEEQRRRSGRAKRKRLYAPKDKLANISLYELGFTFQLFEQFLTTQDEALAERLIAALYRPQKPMTRENKRTDYYGDIRQPLYRLEHLLDKRIKLVKELPTIVKQVLLFWFASCRRAIIDAYPNVFQPKTEMAIAGERVGNDYSYGGMLLALAGGIHNLDQVSVRPFQDGLVYLSYLEDGRQKK